MGIPKNVEVSSSQYWVSDSWVIGLLLLFKDVKLISLLCSKIERYTTLFMIIKPAYWFCSVYGLLVLLLRVIVVASCCRLPHVVLAAAATQGGCKKSHVGNGSSSFVVGLRSLAVAHPLSCIVLSVSPARTSVAIAHSTEFVRLQSDCKYLYICCNQWGCTYGGEW